MTNAQAANAALSALATIANELAVDACAGDYAAAVQEIDAIGPEPEHRAVDRRVG